jgi:peptide/nickel transport system ATP-binding protein
MIFQDPMTSLDPVYKIGYQIVETLRRHDKGLSKHAAEARSVELLELVGIPNAGARARSYPHEFSGGMRQRAVIAIAMANQPEVIIADEPTTALDVTIQAQVLDVLRTAQEETGAATVLITHDLGVVAGFADRVLVMYAGRPVELGSAEDVYYRPRMPYTVGLLGSLPRMDTGQRQRLTPIPGNPPSLVNPPPGCPFGPRCPLHAAICDTEEPPLLAVDGPAHLAACYRSDELVADDRTGEVIAPQELFDVTSADAVAPLGGEEAEASVSEGALDTEAADGHNPPGTQNTTGGQVVPDKEPQQ